tara:strand:+ start:327 stop:530 length:204 start_codon:yes stop_codon:yes gene_type:complete
MSKEKTNNVVEGKYEETKKPTMEESIEILKTQVKDYTEKAEYFKTMSLKAQGALEVLAQLVEETEEP